MAVQNNIRELAAEVLLAVEKKEYRLDDALHSQLLKYQYISKQERSFLTILCEGVMEQKIRLDYCINQFSKTPVNKCKPYIRCLLRMGAYQILFLQSVPDSAACNESVKLAKAHGFARLSGFVNGVLRNLARQQEKITYPDEHTDWISYYSIYYSIPKWILTQWSEQYTKELAIEMAKVSTQTPPLSFRFPMSDREKQKCLELMAKEDLKIETIAVSDAMCECLGKPFIEQLKDVAGYLKNVDYLSRYESFQKGMFTIQDVSSMVPGLVLKQYVKEHNRKEHLLVLDMCAAPGGKTTFAADILKERGTIISRDISDEKTDKIKENCDRLHLSNVTVETQDALEITPHLQEKVDVVILDAPCSGLGVLGRKKEICYDMTLEQEQELVQLQRQMLKVATTYVKPGGLLIFSTCTVNQMENAQNADWFMKQYLEYNEIFRAQMLPGNMPLDGFFVAAFVKQEDREKE